MKTSSLVLLVLYYCLGCCYGYRDMQRMRKKLFKKSWRDHNRLGVKRETAIIPGRLDFSAVPPATKTVSNGESFILLCKVQSIPSANIYWKKDGSRIVQGDSSGSNNNQSLYEQAVTANRPTVRLSAQTARVYVDCFTPAKGGVYECVAEIATRTISHKTIVNPMSVGSDPSIFMDGSILHLMYQVIRANSLPENVDSQCLAAKRDDHTEPARIYLFTTYRIEVANATVQLVCRAEGNPRPSITWFNYTKNPIGRNSTGYVLLPNGDLVLQGWNLVAGFHIFYCTAANRLGNDTVETRVYLTSRRTG